jgi:acetolactate synthase small subunit
MMQGTEQKVKSKISDVTVFLNGAQVKRTAKAPLLVGRNELHFSDLPLTMDQKSLQFNAKAPITILSINHQITYRDDSQTDSLKIRRLEKQLNTLVDEVKVLDYTRTVYQNEKQIIVNNSRFGGSENGTNVAELERGVNLYRTRLLDLNAKLLQLDKKKTELNLNRQKVLNELEVYRRKSSVKAGEVVVVLNCDRAMTAEMTLKYTVTQASWKPYYDIKVKSVSKPLELVYKAKVLQSTGENWDNVKISLSTGDPSKSGTFPPLAPWYLNFTNSRYSNNRNSNKTYRNPGITGQINGLVLDSRTQEAIPFANVVAKNAMDEIVKGTTTDFDGKFFLNLERPANSIFISYIGYDNYSQSINNSSRFYRINLSEGTQELMELIINDDVDLEESLSYSSVESESVQNMPLRSSSYALSGTPGSKKKYKPFIISRNPTTLNFTVDEPYTIPADGSDYLVTLQEYEVDADYLYKASPKLEEHAYLTASISKWEELSLRAGSAGIYYEETYMGETYLDVNNAGDTLAISLGKDEDISIKREAITSKESTRFISSNKEELFHYRIGVRNNKQSSINLIVYDQYPISANDKIKVKQREKSEGKLDEESGLIEWKMELKPQEERDVDLKYEITYPKNTMINIY